MSNQKLILDLLRRKGKPLSIFTIAGYLPKIKGAALSEALMRLKYIGSVEVINNVYHLAMEQDVSDIYQRKCLKCREDFETEEKCCRMCPKCRSNNMSGSDYSETYNILYT